MITSIGLDIDPELSQRGQNSIEKITQEEREQAALGALYMLAAQIPDSAGEPSTSIGDDEIDVDVTAMTVGPECDSVFWREIDVPQPSPTSVADLVGQLSGMPSNSVIQQLGFDPALLSSIPQLPIAPEQVQELMQQAHALLIQQQSGGGVPPAYGGADQTWNATAEYSQGYTNNGVRGRWTDRGQSRGRGRGRGRGEEGGSYRTSKRKPCSFFAEGRRASNMTYFW